MSAGLLFKTDQGVVTVAEAAVGRAGALSKTAVAEAGCAVSAVAVAVWPFPCAGASIETAGAGAGVGASEPVV